MPATRNSGWPSSRTWTAMCWPSCAKRWSPPEHPGSINFSSIANENHSYLNSSRTGGRLPVLDPQDPTGASMSRQKADPARSAPALALILAAFSGLASPPARADDDFIVYSPYVVQNQSEVELRGVKFRDSDPALNQTLDYEFSVSHAFTGWWRPEVYLGAFERTPVGGNHLLGYELENTFQFADPGEYWLDAGFLASYEHRGRPGDVSKVEFGPLLEKRSG